MTALPWEFDDGGRAEAGYRGQTGDCAVRAIAIAVGLSYEEAYQLVVRYGKAERGKKSKSPSHPRNGVYMDTMRRIMADLGWAWVPTMEFGVGTTHHLAVGEVPPGRVICRVSKHYVAVVDGVVHDNHDPSRGGTRALYGYWRKNAEA